MAGGKVLTVIDQPTRRLCCYGGPPFIGWAVFVFKPTKPDEPDWKCICNGKLPEVLKEWLTHN